MNLHNRIFSKQMKWLFILRPECWWSARYLNCILLCGWINGWLNTLYSICRIQCYEYAHTMKSHARHFAINGTQTCFTVQLKAFFLCPFIPSNGKGKRILDWGGRVQRELFLLLLKLKKTLIVFVLKRKKKQHLFEWFFIFILFLFNVLN